jgi:hypothetical protein
MDPEQTGRLREVIAEGEYYGMQTFDQALLKHYQAGRVSMEDALRVASSPHDFKLLVSAGGRTSTSMGDLDDADRSDGPAGPETLIRPAPAPAPAGPGNGSFSAPPNGNGSDASAPPHGKGSISSAPPRGNGSFSAPPPGAAA